MTCPICSGSGERDGEYGLLSCDAPNCTAATERAALEAANTAAEPMTVYDQRWFAYGLGKAAPLTADDVQWIVNDKAELGVKIGAQFFFLYKGRSLIYETEQFDSFEPSMWRPVFKREFGECAHPINHSDYSKIGTVSLGDSDEWKPLKDQP